MGCLLGSASLLPAFAYLRQAHFRVNWDGGAALSRRFQLPLVDTFTRIYFLATAAPAQGSSLDRAAFYPTTFSLKRFIVFVTKLPVSSFGASGSEAPCAAFFFCSGVSSS